MPHVSVEGLSKTFRVYKKDPEASAWRNFWRPVRSEVTAVQDVSFSVERGERVAFIGPNGAGKSTTIKMLVGILQPTAGVVRVAGLHPQDDRRKLAYKIGVLFGQRSQLLQNLPVTDAFELYGAMYDVAPRTLGRRQKELVEVFQLAEFINTPVRKLSLGQRMRAELAVSLLHKPEIIFLDEPTIGLDIVAKKALREVLLKMNQEEEVTIFLTSHDAGDVEAICDRTLVINHGRLVLDSPTKDLKARYFTHKNVRLELADGRTKTLEIDTQKKSLSQSLSELLKKYEVVDIEIVDPSLESVIEEIYAEQA